MLVTREVSQPLMSWLNDDALENIQFMSVTPEEIRRVKALGPMPVVGDFVEDDWRGKRSLHKLDTIRHDPRKVATALKNLVVSDGRE